MQVMIDTSTDSPAELYRIGKFLVDTYATAPAPPHRGAGAVEEATAGLSEAVARISPPSPVFPGTPAPPLPPRDDMQEFAPGPGGHDADDPEVTIDADSVVQSVAAVVELPAAPPPPPSFNVPPPPVPAPPGPAVAAELDKRGRPWDARIHAANRAKKIDGSWKTKRGVDPALITQIEGGVTVPTAAPIPPMTAMQAETVTFGHLAAPPPPPMPPVAPPVSTATAPASTVTAPSAATATASVTPIDFRGLMQKIQSLTAAGKLTADQVNAVLAGVGLKPEEMAQLINNAPLIASVNAAVDKCVTE